MTWFNKQSRLVQLILLLIPGVNWVTEIVVRWTTWLKKGGLLRLISASLSPSPAVSRLVGSTLCGFCCLRSSSCSNALRF